MSEREQLRAKQSASAGPVRRWPTDRLRAAGAGLAVLAVVLLFFRGPLLGGGLYYPGDIARQYLPQRAALARDAATGALPWWTADLGIGYPLLAEGESAALYPFTWLVAAFTDPASGVTVSILLHYLISAAGLYLLARRLGRSRAGAALGALVWGLGGCNLAHLSHLPILSAAAWMPWMLWTTDGLLSAGASRRRTAWGVALAAVAALQVLAGHAQMTLLAWLPTAAYALWRGWPRRGGGDSGEPPGRDRRRALGAWAVWGGAMVLGAILAAPQLLPLLELSGFSQRAGGLDGAYFTSYSFHPALLATYLSPFFRGNPYPEGSVELMGYVGVLPLALAAAAVWRWLRAPRAGGRGLWRSETVFWLSLGLLGTLLAFGRWNPIYVGLQHVPLFNLFRVPARYLYWLSLALALLAAQGADGLSKEAVDASTRRGRWLAMAAAAVLLALAAMALTLDLDRLVMVWFWLPLAWLLLATAWIWGRRHVARGLWLAGVLALTTVDLFVYSAVLDGTYNATWPADQVRTPPASLAFLASDDDLYRIYTKEEILPDLAVARESLYPSMALEYGVQSANLYMPLVPRNYGDYLAGLTAERLNRLNIKYYLIPQLLPVDAASELYDVEDPYAALPAGEWLEIPPTTVAGLTIESYLSHAADLSDGAPAGQLELRNAGGRVVVVPLSVGVDTAEWAYDRDDVRAIIAHSRPEIATNFPARSGFPARDHEGHTYRAAKILDEPFTATAVRWTPALAEAFVRVERVRLADGVGDEQLLSHLLGLGDHTLVYRSEDVVIYRNEDVLPRAFTVAADAAVRGARGVSLLNGLTIGDVSAAAVMTYTDTAVVVSCDLAAGRLSGVERSGLSWVAGHGGRGAGRDPPVRWRIPCRGPGSGGAHSGSCLPADSAARRVISNRLLTHVAPPLDSATGAGTRRGGALLL